MSDIGSASPAPPAAPATGAPSPAPVPAAPPPAPPAAPPAAGGPGGDWDVPYTQSGDVDWDAVEQQAPSWDSDKSLAAARKLRRENEKNRTKFQPYQQALDPYDDASRETWLRAMQYSAPQQDGESDQMFQARQAEVARFFAANLHQFAGDKVQDLITEFSQPPETAPAATDLPTDPAEFQAWLDQKLDQRLDERLNAQAQQQQQQAAVDARNTEISSTLTELGYTPGSWDAEFLCGLVHGHCLRANPAFQLAS